jgi:ATP-dependent DNA helicase RecQ
VVELLVCPDDLPTLENFAFGDTPTESAMRGLVTEILEQGEEFALNLYDLSARYDLRPLVLRTALTYLELRGVLRQGTPFYSGYTVTPLIPLAQIVGQYSGEPGQFVASLFANARRGKTKYHLNPDDMAVALNQERRRVVRALEVLEEKGWVELSASDVRHRYTRLMADASAKALAAELNERFLRREEQEIARLQQVIELVTHEGCQTNALVGYFGEERAEPCGHCTYCVTGRAQRLLPTEPLAALPAGLEAKGLIELRQAYPDALGEARQMARFLSGLTSPALTRAKLARHELFGRWEAYRFREVLAFIESL